MRKRCLNFGTQHKAATNTDTRYPLRVRQSNRKGDNNPFTYLPAQEEWRESCGGKYVQGIRSITLVFIQVKKKGEGGHGKIPASHVSRERARGTIFSFFLFFHSLRNGTQSPAPQNICCNTQRAPTAFRAMAFQHVAAPLPSPSATHTAHGWSLKVNRSALGRRRHRSSTS